MASPYQRLSITFPEDIAQQVREAAAAAGETISGWLLAAAEYELRLAAGRQLLADYEAERGPITPEEEAAMAAKIAEAEHIADEEHRERVRRSA